MITPAAVKSRVSAHPWVKPLLKGINDLRCGSWDLIHGVDTCGQIPLASLAFDSEHKTAGLEYYSHHPSVTRSALSRLDAHGRYTFIDIGCGKGRALLVASEFPFRKITGLEFAPPLAEIARRNVQRYRGRKQKCRDIEVITGDALEYELAPEPQVLHLYSPFAPKLLDRLMQRIEDSYRSFPRTLLMMFSGTPIMRNRMADLHPEYAQLRRERHLDIYRHR